MVNPSLVTFVLRHPVVKVTSSVFQPAMSKKRTILSLDLRIEVLCCLDEAHRVACLLPSLCGKPQMARDEADRADIVAEWNSGDLVDINT